MATLSKNQTTLNAWVYFWTLNSVPSISIPILMPGPYCLDFSMFLVKLWNQQLFFLLFKTVLAVLSSLNFHMNFRNILPKLEEGRWNFNIDCSESINHFVEYCFNNINPSNPWTCNIFPFVWFTSVILHYFQFSRLVFFG